VKHLIYEHQKNITEIKSQNVTALKLAQSEQAKSEKNLKKDKRGLTTQLKEEELSHETYIKNLKKVSRIIDFKFVVFSCFLHDP
jgi:hypothetical protein